MTQRPIKNMAASVRQRLTNVAKDTNRPFSDVLQYYALERWLFRLSRSKHRDRFVLKGALLFVVWQAPATRPTRDIDLLGRLKNDLESIRAVVAEVCQTAKAAQWNAFVGRIRRADAPMDFAAAVRQVRDFLQPVAHTLVAGNAFDGHWSRGGPW